MIFVLVYRNDVKRAVRNIVLQRNNTENSIPGILTSRLRGAVDKIEKEGLKTSFQADIMLNT